MATGRTKKGRARGALTAAVASARPLLKGYDHGDGIPVRGTDVGASGDRWVEPFLDANRSNLRRLELSHVVQAGSEVRILLKPGARIGAVPLLSPTTRRVAAGLLIEPRFQWAALGAVFDSIGFSVPPGLGDAPLVPGSAREVPPWMLAGPVIERIAALLRHQRRGFVEQKRDRTSPRGRVEWSKWATCQVPKGAWTTFPCCFSEPDDDPDLIATIRWTLSRLEEDLQRVAWSLPCRHLLERTTELQLKLGPGTSHRPMPTRSLPGASEWVSAALEAMTWVAEERGLGGARSLDGLAWDLSIEAVWEAWVARFAGQLARQTGMVASPFQGVRRSLRWEGPAHSMSSLVPDVELRGANRTIWLDAKYKRHLELLCRKDWNRLSEDIRSDHRADLHQALAYASLSDAPKVDTVLVYPEVGPEQHVPPTITSVTSGHRQVRLILASLPFGFRNPNHQESCLQVFRQTLAA